MPRKELRSYAVWSTYGVRSLRNEQTKSLDPEKRTPGLFSDWIGKLHFNS